MANDRDWNAETDPFLDSLIESHFIDYTEDSPPQGAVLLVGGSTITGNIIPFGAFLKRTAVGVPESSAKDGIDAMAPYSPSEDHRFLVVSDATIHDGIRKITTPSIRVRRDRIDAWSFGTVESETVQFGSQAT